MRRIIIVPLVLLALTLCFAMRGETQSAPEAIAPQDSTIDVIAWFNKHDTVTYRIDEYSWKLSETDTVLSASFSMIARVNVVDSTAKGYKMEYTFLDFPIDTLPDSASAIDRFQNQITERLVRKIVGKTIHFETNEYGRITKYNNLGQIKKQAKSLFNEAMNEFSKVPELQELKKIGFDLKDYVKKVDTDKLVDGYLEELNMLFVNHGLSIKFGDNIEHEEASDTQYENTTYTSASIDTEYDSYSIAELVTSVVPRSELKEMIGGIVESFSNDSVTNSFKEDFETQVTEDCRLEDCLKIDYLNNGWPYYVEREKSSMIGNRGRVTQTVISIESFSF